MEQHPVPQNVTTFQFRLIGDMTIKQFGYLAGGVILAYISYKLPLPFFFSWPMAIVFALGGFGFAFIPVEERPMDVWVLSFIKSIYSPTLFVWQKAPPAQEPQAVRPVPATSPVAASAPAPFIQPRAPTAPVPQMRSVADVVGGVFSSVKPVTPAIHPAVQSPPVPQVTRPMTQSFPVSQVAPIQPPRAQTFAAPPMKGPGIFSWITQLFSFQPQPKPQAQVSLSSAPHISMPTVTGRHLDVSIPPTVSTQKAAEQQQAQLTKQKELALEGKMKELKKELEGKAMTETRVLDLQKQLAEVLAQKNTMESEVMLLRKQAAASVQTPSAATPPPPVVKPLPPPVAPAPQPAPAATAHIATPTIPKAPTVKIITPEGAVKAGLPRLTTFPNVVTGITKDSENNFLPGVLITVKDKNGMPLRALKTNRLGQFAASTPLANGVYFVEIEDPRGRFTFDRVQITLNGSIVPALEIIAKSQKEITRAHLEKELFGTKTS